MAHKPCARRCQPTAMLNWLIDMISATANNNDGSAVAMQANIAP